PPPEQVRRQALNNKQGRAEETVPPELQQKVLEILRRDQSAAYASYQEMLQDDIARELARINLPTSLYTQWYWQMDLHNLLHFIALRIDPHAQWEIRQYARALLKLARAVAPMAVASFERHEMNGCRLSVDEVQAVKRILKGEPNPLSGRKLDEFNRKFLAESDGAPPKLRELSRDEINRLPLRCYEGPISVIAEGEALRKAIQELRTEKVLGFDTETRPAFQKGESYPPALIQLAGSQKAYIFQLQALAGCEALMEILADPAIVKAGVAHKRDVEDLARLYPFQPAGFIDLADLSSRAGIAHNGLRGIAAAALGFRMSKREQRSNWARKDLTESQIRYAATDAWVGREIYLALAPKSRAGG
ncbi:MAG: FAD-dependent thymidylate synthase, partial [Kiritimatiellia bacterium]|nr:FAD-dependent thymidylate synthase [Kiritimatiellia bacterium]